MNERDRESRHERTRREGLDRYGRYHWGQPHPRSERVPWSERVWNEQRAQPRESFPRDQQRQIEDEFSDESAVSYERGALPPGYRGRGYDPYGRPGLDRTGVNARSGQGAGRLVNYPIAHYPAEQRAYPRGPKGYQRSDERLKEDICERLWEAYHIDSSEVTVEVKSGKVSLEGSVPNRYMKHSIEDIVDATPGVMDIDNHVRVGTAVTTPTPAAKR